MNNFVSFITDNYIWFIVITIFLIFALIGYLYDTKMSKSDYIAKEESNLVNNEEQLQAKQSIDQNVESPSVNEKTVEIETGINLENDEKI